MHEILEKIKTKVEQSEYPGEVVKKDYNKKSS